MAATHLNKNWDLRGQDSSQAPHALCEQLEISPRFLELLWNRGFQDATLIDQYLSPSPSRLTFPDRWPLIPKAAELIVQALLADKILAVWGDYDVDGISATALVLDVLEFHGFKPLYHLPNRFKEGYGLNIAGLEELAAKGSQVLLTVDCGISDVNEISKANELGMQVIVSDHHLPPFKLPDAAAIVNPRLEAAGPWPCANLAGVGVAFYLMAQVNRILAQHTGKHFKMDKVLDLVALGTLADVMDVEGENRILIHAGLNQMRKSARPGLSALKSISGLDSSTQVSTDQALFQLTPKINAPGRLGDPDLSLKLLRAPNITKAEEYADELNKCNQKRKSMQEQIFLEASRQAEEALKNEDSAALVVYGADWHPGIIGIIAAKITEEYKKPCFALCDDANKLQDEKMLRGSGRSLEGIDLFAAISACQQDLSSFGGHKMAAGICLAENKLPQFREDFSKAVHEQQIKIPNKQTLFLDGMLNFSQAYDNEFLAELNLMEPFGPGNPEPVFLSPALFVKNRRYLGQRTDSIILELEDRSTKPPRSMRAKIWRKAHEFPASLLNSVIQIAYTPKKTEYNSLPAYEAVIKDWKIIKNVERIEKQTDSEN